MGLGFNTGICRDTAQSTADGNELKTVRCFPGESAPPPALGTDNILPTAPHGVAGMDSMQTSLAPRMTKCQTPKWSLVYVCL